MMDRKNITGVILAGGKSQRMGRDKGLVLLDGKPFIQHISDVLSLIVHEIIIVSNNKEYDAFGYKRVPDIVENSGPLGGLYTGLHHTSTEFNLVLSCDVPRINSPVLQQLILACDTNTDIIQLESEGETIPLIAIYKKHCKDVFLKLLNQGERRLRFAVDQCKTKMIIIDDSVAKATMNINTQDQLKEVSNDIDS